MRRRLAITVLALAIGAGALAVLAHAPFVRASVLRYAVAAVEDRYGIRVEASRLDYNLSALRVGLADVVVSAVTSVDGPFFSASYVSVAVPWRSLTGGVELDDLTTSNAGVRIVRRADGTSNLPQSSGDDGEESPALRIGRIRIPQLSIEVVDESADLELRAPDAAIDLSRADGRIALNEPATLRIGARAIEISELQGPATFDGRALDVTAMSVRTREASAALDGRLLLIAREPGLDLRVRGTGDVARMVRLGAGSESSAEGEVAFDGRITGAMSDPQAELDLTSSRFSWSRLQADDILARAAVSRSELRIAQLQFGFEGGRVGMSGTIPFDAESVSSAFVTWSDVPVASIVEALADGAIVPAAVVSGAIELEGAWSRPAGWQADLRIRSDAGTNGPRRIAVGGEGRLLIRQGEWRYDGEHLVGTTVPATLALRGALTDPFRFQQLPLGGTVTLARTEIPALIELLRATDLGELPDDAITAGAMEGTLEVTGRLAEPRISFALRAPDTLVVRDQRLDNAAVTGRFASGVIEVESLTFRQSGGTGTVTAVGSFEPEARIYVLESLEALRWQLAPMEELPAAGVISGWFTGRGRIDDPMLAGQLHADDARWRESAIGDIDAAVRLDGRVATIDATVPNVQLRDLLRGIETPLPVRGFASNVSLHAEGSIDDWRSGSAVLSVADFESAVGGLSVRTEAPAQVRYVDGRVTIDTLEGAIGDSRVSASGDIAAFAGSPGGESGLLIVLTGTVDAVARAVVQAGFTEEPITEGEGPVALLARVSGSIEAPAIEGDLEVGPGTFAVRDLPPFSDVRIRVHADGRRVELRELAATYQGARIDATGEGPMAAFTRDPAAQTAGEMRLRARATNVTPDVLEPFLDPATLADLAGSLDATLDATSRTLNPENLSGTLTLDRFDVRVADLPVTQREPTRIVARDGTAVVESWNWVGQGATMTIGGQVRLADLQAALLVGGVIDLRMLTPFVRDAGISIAGRAEPRIFVRGSLGGPGLDGDITVGDAELRLANPRVVVSNLTARAELDGTSARIPALSGLVNGGPLTGSGIVDYRPDGRMTLQLSAESQGVALEFPQGLRSELDAALSLALQTSGDDGVPPAGRVSGTVTVRRGAYREPLAVVTELLTTLRTRRLAAAAQPSPILDALALDVRVVTDEDLIVDNNYGRFQLGGDLRVIGTAAAPSLSGRADLREGGQLFIGRNVYRITFGTIDFANPVTIEPDLNVAATTRAGGEDIEVTITGTPENLQVALESPTSPLLGQSELASLLLTGRRFEDLAPGDASFVSSQVLGNFSGEVLGFAGRAVGLDSVRLGGVDTSTVRRTAGSVAADLDPTTRLTFGKNIARNVELTYSQSLRDSNEQTWIVDYFPLRRLQLRFMNEDDNRRSFEFRHDVEFGQPLTFARPATGTAAGGDVRVSSVLITGELVLAEDRLRERLSLEPRDRFDFVEWQDDRERLEALYREEGYLRARISATRADAGAGTALTYTVTAGPRTVVDVTVSEATVSEATGWNASASLRAQLENAWVLSVFDGFLVDEATAIVRGDLARQGYLQPMIDVRVTGDAVMQTLSVAVESGPRTSDTRIVLNGVDGALAEEIDTFIETDMLAARATLDPGGAAESVAAFLRAGGYLRAQVSAGAFQFENSTAIVPLTVDTGPLVRISSVSFPGARTLDVEALREAAAIEEGTPFDASLADASRDRVQALYRREGYPVPVVRVVTTFADTAQVELQFAVEEGTRQVVQEVVVSGNSRIDTDVVVRAIDLPPGAPLRTEALLRARTRVFETGLFRRVDLSVEPGRQAEADPAVSPMRVVVTVEEWAALRLRYGFALAQEQPVEGVEARDVAPGFSADITRRTFFGRALTTGGAVEYQPGERLGRVFLSAASLFGTPIESSLVLERSREEFAADSLVTDRSSISWEQRVRVGPYLGLSYSYRFERDHTFDTQVSPDPNDIPFDLTLNIGRVTGSAAFDSRDDAADATRGLLASFSIESAPGSAGSDIRFVRQLTQSYYFRGWREAVLASAARFGVVTPLGGQDVIPSERFFAGGARTVRGVAEDTLGGLDFLGFPVGGRALLIFNQEVRFPLYRWIRGVGFVDAGNVFATPADVRVGDLVGSIGAGLRLATPFALLRLDYGRPVWNTPADNSGRWTFGIGQAF